MSDNAGVASDELLAAAHALERLAAASTGGEWRLTGLLATRPEVITHHDDGTTEHIAEARTRSARWIAALSPQLAAPLAEWLRSAARQERVDPAAVEVARVLRRRIPS
ncbi:hypothetical protein HUO13_16105 [Saccharopolyspora erythraea]|nr:hypothetical protein HUO13_16105 [Saccharopolyspora erythraea]